MGKGTVGYIVGEVKRFDERETVFARVRSLRPGFRQYRAFYEKNPQFETTDNNRREVGGFIGRLGTIDKPYAGPNLAATQASGALPWYLSAPEMVKPAVQENFTCYGYWFKVGTDCCICMKVCPWSHARTFPHKLIVEMITRNSLSRRLFSVMDDICYGKKPKPMAPPKWAKFSPFS